ncbi:MAG: hypothetical protein JST16_03535 [Bdellovibrionales bacterium]|nr:hypothetical protein [Bdellovibrionales bacterium]
MAGFGLAQVLIATAAVGGLGVVVASLMNNLNRTHKTVSILNVASDLETRFRAVTLSSRALSNTRAANPGFATCFDAATGCSSNGPQPIELRDAANNILIPRPSTSGGSVTVDDGGSLCTPSPSNPGCRWSAVSEIQPLGCSAPGCHPQSFDLVSEIRPLESALKMGTPLAPRRIQAKAVPKEMFMGASSSTLSCPAGQVMKGLLLDGTPDCVDGMAEMCAGLGGIYNSTSTPKCDLKGTRKIVCRQLVGNPAVGTANSPRCSSLGADWQTTGGGGWVHNGVWYAVVNMPQGDYYSSSGAAGTTDQFRSYVICCKME